MVWNWRKSSYSDNDGGNCVEVADLVPADGERWIKSTYSNGNGGDCVEIAPGHSHLVPVRDSKVKDGPVLLVGAVGFAVFVESLKSL